MVFLSKKGKDGNVIYNSIKHSDGLGISPEYLQSSYYFYADSSYWNGEPGDFASVWQISNPAFPADAIRLPSFIRQNAPFPSYYDKDVDALRLLQGK